MEFLKKNASNILFFAFILFLFTPYGVPVRAGLIKGVSYVSTRVFSVELNDKDKERLKSNNWELISLDHQLINLNQFEGQVVIVNFWATWCPPCIAEMPSFQKLHNDYQEKAVFMFVAHDDKQKVISFMDKKKYTFPVYFESSQRPVEMNSNSLPTTYILNKKSEIVVNKTGALDWNSNKVRELLDELID